MIESTNLSSLEQSIINLDGLEITANNLTLSNNIGQSCLESLSRNIVIEYPDKNNLDVAYQSNNDRQNFKKLGDDDSFLFKVSPLIETDIIDSEKPTYKISNSSTSTELETLILPLAATNITAQPKIYYISSSGNDQNLGTSSTSAWRSLSKVNSMTFAPGDQILFEGGSTFTGQLQFNANDQGSASNPIKIGSYGSGRATINAGTKTGVTIYNIAGYQISNLKIVGSGTSTNTGDGIRFYNDLAGNVKLDTIAINNVDVSGFRDWGIAIGSWKQQSGFRNVTVSGVNTFNNGKGGLLTYAQVPDVHENVKVSYTRAYSNLGLSNVNYATGSGIVLSGVNGGIIERSVAYDNGRLNTNPVGAGGIWTYDSTGVVIQYNEAYRNRTGSKGDGNGFDLDNNVSNSIMQYNYSHENDGAGFMLCEQGNNPDNTGNIIRYNISQNDGRKSGWGGIHLYGPINNAQIYNNTVYVQNSSTTFGNAVAIHTPVNNVRLHNNIFQVKDNARWMYINGTAATQSTGLVFQGNNYFSPSGTPYRIQLGSKSYTSLDSWRTATGQERLNGQATGSSVDPLLSSPGTAPTINNPDLLDNLSAYRLGSSSPMIDRGLDLSQFGINSGNQDFFGNSIPQGLGYDIGANEF